MNEIKTWRECPFEKGQKYTVHKAIKALRSEFTLGEILLFSHDTYSRYDSMTGYVFKTGSGIEKILDIPDSDDMETITKNIN